MSAMCKDIKERKKRYGTKIFTTDLERLEETKRQCLYNFSPITYCLQSSKINIKDMRKIGVTLTDKL
jgi:hypothetical protein